MKFHKTGSRVPHFRQIIQCGTTIAGLAADAGGDTGTVWVYIRPDDVLNEFNVEGWVRLANVEIERID